LEAWATDRRRAQANAAAVSSDGANAAAKALWTAHFTSDSTSMTANLASMLARKSATVAR